MHISKSKSYFNLKSSAIKNEKNRLLRKGRSNIYSKLLLRRSQNFDFLALKNLSPGQFWGAPTHADIAEF